MSPNGRMCALNSLLPPFPTNPLSQHRNTLCAHGCVVVDGDSVFVCATRGRGTYYSLGTLDPRQSRTSWPQSFPGPALCAPTPSGPNSLLVFTCHSDSQTQSRPHFGPDGGSFTGVPPAPHGAFSLMTGSHDPPICAALCAGAPEASWPRSAFPASRMTEVSRRLMTASRTLVIPGSFPGGDAGPHGPAPLSPRELLKWSRAT